MAGRGQWGSLGGPVDWPGSYRKWSVRVASEPGRGGAGRGAAGPLRGTRSTRSGRSNSTALFIHIGRVSHGSVRKSMGNLSPVLDPTLDLHWMHDLRSGSHWVRLVLRPREKSPALP